MIATQVELEHTIRALRAENGDLRLALSQDAERLERDDEAREKSSSRFWFAAWKNSQIANQRLLAEIARMKEERRG